MMYTVLWKLCSEHYVEDIAWCIQYCENCSEQYVEDIAWCIQYCENCVVNILSWILHGVQLIVWWILCSEPCVVDIAWWIEPQSPTFLILSSLTSRPSICSEENYPETAARGDVRFVQINQTNSVLVWLICTKSIHIVLILFFKINTVCHVCFVSIQLINLH